VQGELPETHHTDSSLSLEETSYNISYNIYIIITILYHMSMFFIKKKEDTRANSNMLFFKPEYPPQSLKYREGFNIYLQLSRPTSCISLLAPRLNRLDSAKPFWAFTPSARMYFLDLFILFSTFTLQRSSDITFHNQTQRTWDILPPKRISIRGCACKFKIPPIPFFFQFVILAVGNDGITNEK